MGRRAGRAKQAKRCACDCLAVGGSTRRGFFAVLSAFGWNLAAAVVPALAQPASERPKEGDLLVAIDGEKA